MMAEKYTTVKENMEVAWIALSEIKPYQRNARKIPQKAIDKVALSLHEFGWQQPIVLDKTGVIVAGHTRLLAAQQLKMTHAPCIVADQLTPAQVKAYRLMDNRSHQESDWDMAILPLEIADLNLDGIDLGLTGFDSFELESLLATDRDDDAANETPEVPEVAVSRPGDLWELGPHRLLCGDSTKAEDVARLLGIAKPNLMVTDPPYGVEYDPAWRNEAAKNGSISYAARSVGKVQNDGIVDWSAAYGLFPGAVAYVWHADRFAGEVADSLEACTFEIRNQIIWAKTVFAISRGAYHWQHEPCWYAVRKGGKANWCGDRSQSTLWSVPTLDGQSRTGHGTQKPVELMRRPILNHTKRGDAVYDPFLGSGTTLIAAQELERVCYGLEIDPKYCDVIVQRWSKFADKRATLADDGRTFETIAAERMAVKA